MGRITIQNYHDCYLLGKEIHLKKQSRKEAVEILVNSGMAEKSAVYYLQCVASMLEGKRYTATVKELAISYYLTQIFSDYGMAGLKKALNSLHEHLMYQKGKNELPGQWKLYYEFLEYTK